MRAVVKSTFVKNVLFLLFFFPSSFLLFFPIFLYRVWNMKQFNLFCQMQLDFYFMKTSPQTGDGLMSLLGIQYSQWNPEHPSAPPQREIHWILALIVVQLKIYFYSALFQELFSQSCATEPCFPLKNKKSKESSFFFKKINVWNISFIWFYMGLYQMINSVVSMGNSSWHLCDVTSLLGAMDHPSISGVPHHFSSSLIIMLFKFR